MRDRWQSSTAGYSSRRTAVLLSASFKCLNVDMAVCAESNTPQPWTIGKAKRGADLLEKRRMNEALADKRYHT